MAGISTAAPTVEFDRTINWAAARHGIDADLLKSIAILESNMNPLAINIDGEPFTKFHSVQHAMRTLDFIQTHQWMVKYDVDGSGPKKRVRRFFRSEYESEQFASQNSELASAKQYRGGSLKFPENKGKPFFLIRNLWMKNSDIGLTQINYRWHGEDLAPVSSWLTPSYNLNYAAKHLKELLVRYDHNVVKAVAHYHSGSIKHQRKYLAKWTLVYKKIKEVS